MNERTVKIALYYQLQNINPKYLAHDIVMTRLGYSINRKD